MRFILSYEKTLPILTIVLGFISTAVFGVSTATTVFIAILLMTSIFFINLRPQVYRMEGVYLFSITLLVTGWLTGIVVGALFRANF
ncbi:MAG: hypothetical protein CL760_03540 [Chloroflexi bacterium]|nr:hypothetical protein [Chloroflexota bacterium]MCH2308554.1 hypothetical protein [SAR202 cluster bacterium]MQG05573.1 hypothetical protein [SAR202 cluster bacterium]|tara:strand:+ start:238 stop:495 length:258 start_codon:yes stop_codon:yes gene_type:complete